MDNNNTPPNGDRQFEAWEHLAGEDKRFFQVLREDAFWKVPFPERLALFSWGAFGINLLLVKVPFL